MRYSKLAICLSVAFVTLLVSGCSTTTDGRIKFKMETSESPAVMGIGRYQHYDKSTMRLHGSFKYGTEGTIEKNANYKDWLGNSGVVEGTFHFSNFGLTGGLEWFHKFDKAVIGFGFAFGNGFYHHVTYGFNSKDIEFGVFLGLLDQEASIEVVGSRKSSSVLVDFFGGFYLNIFIGKNVFLSYCFSSYSPEIKVKDSKVSNVDSPQIISNYVTLGYHINETFAVTMGAVATIADFVPLFSVSLGTFVYLF